VGTGDWWHDGAGEAIVRRFQLSGATVATTARSSLSQGQAPNLFVQADIGTPSGVQQMVYRILQEWGGPDILVNDVSGTETKPGGRGALGRGLAKEY
jgi:NAD(P)-dependent dehydrogenase (short-subunit alcohol dehydrogenase family)